MSDLVKVRYVGAHVDGVDVDVPWSDQPLHFPKGEVVEVASDLAYGSDEPEVGDDGGPLYDAQGQLVMRRARAGLLEPGREDFEVVADEPKKRATREEE